MSWPFIQISGDLSGASIAISAIYKLEIQAICEDAMLGWRRGGVERSDRKKRKARGVFNDSSRLNWLLLVS